MLQSIKYQMIFERWKPHPGQINKNKITEMQLNLLGQSGLYWFIGVVGIT